MRRTVIIGIIITLIISIGLLSIPKNELPTDEQWEAYLEEINRPDTASSWR